MGLEAGSYVLDLVATNPVGGDQKQQGDDHIRLLKSVLRTTFPDASRPFYFPKAATISGDTTLVASQGNTVFGVSSAAGAVAITLPTLVAGDHGWSAKFVKTNAEANNITITPPSGTINGAASYVLTTRYRSVEIVWDGTSFRAYKPQIETSDIITAMLADLSVTTAKIADDNVTLAKLAHGTQGGIPYYGASGAPADLGAGINYQVLRSQGAGANPLWAYPISPLLHLQHVLSSGVAGGNSTNETWTTRLLNSEARDDIGSTLSSGQFTLPVGTYDIDAWQSFQGGINGYHSRLYNVTDGVVVLLGMSGRATTGVSPISTIKGRFAVAGSTKTYRLEYWGENASSDGQGLGIPAGAPVTNELYAECLITKVA